MSVCDRVTYFAARAFSHTISLSFGKRARHSSDITAALHQQMINPQTAKANKLHKLCTFN